MKSKYNIIIACDPDVKKSGVFTLYPHDKTYVEQSLLFPHLLTYLQAMNEAAIRFNNSAVCVVEAGWLNQSHWHIPRTGSMANVKKAAQIGNATGRNHEVGRKIVEWCEYINLDIVEQKPYMKCWKGQDKKITHEEINEILGNLGMKQMKSSNQEVRDAALISLLYHNLPIRVSAK